jgi:hypothetical protein
VLHDVEADQGSCSSEASLTMDGDRAFFFLDNLQEFMYNIIRRTSSIRELKINMVDSVLLKDLLIISRLVKSDDKRYSEFLEDGHVILRRERSVFVMYRNWAGERNKLSGNGPVKISILYLLEVLVLLNIEI